LKNIYNQNTIDIICFDKILLSKGTVRKIKYNGKLPYLYTLDTDDEFNKAKEYGVDGFFTDFTGLAVRIIR
jgi:glycerophosphoryl diester phosphodiesterase